MSMTPRQGRDSRFLDKTELLKLRTKAMRSGIWFNALQRIDRVLVNLTITVASNIRSQTLAKSILTIMRKLRELLEDKLSNKIKSIGIPIAQKLSMFAQKWGNRKAQEWQTDLRFVRYLAIMKLNSYPLTVECCGTI
jgi:hypothetical protein